jgi:LPXTG-site transpeptidase (sortase) family protein
MSLRDRWSHKRWPRAREVTIFDSHAGGYLDQAPPARRSRRSLVTATCVPAAIAAVGGALLAPSFDGPDGSRLGPASASAASLAREANGPGGLPPLLPVVERDGRPQLATYPAPAPAVSTRPAPPARISIPAARVDAPVDAVGAARGELAVPSLGRAGWWDGGPRPGEDGRAVIVGHLDSHSGPDVFGRVPDLSRGDAILVRDQAGGAHHYSVVGVTRVRKAKFPTDDVYGPASRPVLVLVTCGGPWDAALGHYRDNVLVYARAL